MEVERREYVRDPMGTSTGGQFTVTTHSAPARQQKPSHSQEPVIPAASRRWNLLGPGEDNDKATVKQLQGLLSALGLGKLATDGKFGPNTEAAVKAAQRRLGIKPNGKASRALVNKLLAAYDLSPCIKRSAEPEEPMYEILRADTEIEDATDDDLSDFLASLSDQEIDELGSLAESIHAEGGDGE